MARSTLRENCRVFDDVLFRPRCAVSTPADLRTKVLGADLALPFALAPVGSSRMFYPRGEVVAAGAAGEAGTAYTLSTLSGCRVDEVGAGTQGPLWYQLYLVGGRDVATAGLERATKAGASALFVTIDTAVAGLRERDFRNGTKELLTRNPWTMLPYVHQFLLRPRWLAGFIADGGLMDFPNVVLPDGPMSYADVGAALEQSTVCWADLRWIREVWKGPIVIKGLMIGDDARRAVDAGADGVVVSNHGGRQLDCVYPTLRALPEVVAAVNGQCDVLLDGGIRRGSDIAKALLPGREGGAHRSRVRLRPRRWWRGGSREGDRDSARGLDSHAQAARMPVGHRARRILRHLSRRLAQPANTGPGVRQREVVRPGPARAGHYDCYRASNYRSVRL